MGTVEARERALDPESIATLPDDILPKGSTKGREQQAQQSTFSPATVTAPKTPLRTTAPNRRNNGVAWNIRVSRRRIIGQIEIF